MRRLYPSAEDGIDLGEAYDVDAPGGSPYVRVNMVSSLDGAATIGGRVAALTGPADQELLLTLRGLADVVLVGAGTIRAEGYGALDLPAPWLRRRAQAGQAPHPRLAVLTRSLDLDLSGAAFTDATTPTLVITAAAAPAARRAAAAEVAEVVVAGEENVDLAAAVRALAERGLPRILSEGGPHVLAGLFAADLVDELCLALSPLVVRGDGLAITAGEQRFGPRGMRLAQVLEQDDYLFLRYLREARTKP